MRRGAAVPTMVSLSCTRARCRRLDELSTLPPSPTYSIKREIGHLCRDERRTTGKDRAPAAASNALPNPPIDVARVLPGEWARPSSQLLEQWIRCIPRRTQLQLSRHPCRPPSTTLPGLRPWAWHTGSSRRRHSETSSPSSGICPYPSHKKCTLGRPCIVFAHSDFLNSLEDSSIWGTDASAVAPSMMSAPQFNTVQPPDPTPNLPLDPTGPSSFDPPSSPQPANNTENSPPTAPEKSSEAAPVVLPAPTKTERFFLTAADQASGSRNERLNMVIRSKYEAGLLKPYNYVKGYARLSRWMDRKCVHLRELRGTYV